MSLEEAAKTVSNIRAVSDKIAIMIDTKGPEVRTAVVEPPLELHSGDRISISGIHDSGLVKVNYDDFTDFVEPGKRILIDDGGTGTYGPRQTEPGIGVRGAQRRSPLKAENRSTCRQSALPGCRPSPPETWSLSTLRRK